ncbi:MAG: hypothetical protein AAGC46_19700 [Solirubrobacteraceae bacterium]|nr:hypothetical protein [Patulibacter sp.]
MNALLKSTYYLLLGLGPIGVAAYEVSDVPAGTEIWASELNATGVGFAIAAILTLFWSVASRARGESVWTTQSDVGAAALGVWAAAFVGLSTLKTKRDFTTVGEVAVVVVAVLVLALCVAVSTDTGKREEDGAQALDARLAAITGRLAALENGEPSAARPVDGAGVPDMTASALQRPPAG